MKQTHQARISEGFNQDIARAKRAAEKGPVIITDRGRPAFVLQSYENWRRQSDTQPGVSLLDALTDADSANIEFEPAQLADLLARPVDLN